MSSNDFFKVKKGLNIRPSDPADNTNPEVGDIIVDSTDSNRVKVFNSDTQAFQEVGGGVNLVSDWESFTPTMENIPATSEISGKYRRVGDSVQVQVYALFSTSGVSSSTVYFNPETDLNLIPDTNKITSGGTFNNMGSALWYDDAGGLGGPLMPMMEGSKLAFMKKNSNSFVGTDLASPDRISFNVFIPIQGWSSATDAVVRKQDATKETVNEINIMSSSSSITTTDFGNTSDYTVSTVGDEKVLDFTSLGLTVPPVVQATIYHIGGVSANVTVSLSSAVTTTQARIYTRNADNNTNFNPDYIHWSIKKQGADVNTSQTIVGVFENINSSDLAVVRGVSNSAQQITASTEAIDFSSVEDNYNAWSQTFEGTDTFTAPKSGYYLVSGSVRLSSAVVLLRTYVNNLSSKTVGSTYGASQPRVTFQGIEYLNEGDTLQIRPTATITLASDNTDHWIHIQELPDTESIIKNLYPDVAARYTSSSATVDFPHTLTTPMVYEEFDYDTNGAYNTSTGEYTVPETGYYNITALLTLAGGTWSIEERMDLYVYVNGSVKEKICSNVSEATITFNRSCNGSTNLRLNQGDIVTIRAYHNEDNTLNPSNQSVENSFSIIRIK